MKKVLIFFFLLTAYVYPQFNMGVLREWWKQMNQIIRIDNYYDVVQNSTPYIIIDEDNQKMYFQADGNVEIGGDLQADDLFLNGDSLTLGTIRMYESGTTDYLRFNDTNTGIYVGSDNLLNFQSNNTTMFRFEGSLNYVEVIRPYNLQTQHLADHENNRYITIQDYDSWDNQDVFMEIGDADSAGNLTSIWIDDENKTISINADTVLVGGVRKYVALLTQSGTNAPVATVLENTSGYTITWSYGGVGIYNCASLPNYYILSIRTFSESDATTGANGKLQNCPVEVRFHGDPPDDGNVEFIVGHMTRHMETKSYKE